jgi:hypothetical protein
MYFIIGKAFLGQPTRKTRLEQGLVSIFSQGCIAKEK